ncbi:MAG TPA: hypothetical protein PK597_02555, partial [Oscillospiraceae bacterium]|nr:hypothetical protein [Oscillospiraceae bacterium]
MLYRRKSLAGFCRRGSFPHKGKRRAAPAGKPSAEKATAFAADWGLLPPFPFYHSAGDLQGKPPLQTGGRYGILSCTGREVFIMNELKGACILG